MSARPSNPDPLFPSPDSRLPLLLGLLVALVLHAGLLPMLVSGMGTGMSKSADRMVDVDEPPLPQPDEPVLGRETPAVSTLSWISHEDYRELVAPKAQTEQPALQDVVDPVAEAPPIRDATVPMPAPQSEQTPAATAAPQEPTPPVEPQPATAAAPDIPLPEPVPDGELARLDPAEPAEVVEPTPPTEQPQQPRPAAAPSPESRPTSAARDEQTVDPTSLTDSDLEVTTGNVMVGQGIEITTARPDITVITALFAASIRNTRVEIKFNAEGQVDQARLLNSTGNESVDGAVLASLYKWKAKGERLELADPHIIVTIDYRFTR